MSFKCAIMETYTYICRVEALFKSTDVGYNRPLAYMTLVY